MTIRNVRNFWTETHVDGRNRTDATGPKSSSGGTQTTIYVRVAGRSVKALTVTGRSLGDQLILDVTPGYESDGLTVKKDEHGAGFRITCTP